MTLGAPMPDAAGRTRSSRPTAAPRSPRRPKGDEAVVLTCQQLDVDPVRIKGRDGTEPRSHGHGMTESDCIEEFRDLQLLIAYREDQLTR